MCDARKSIEGRSSCIHGATFLPPCATCEIARLAIQARAEDRYGRDYSLWDARGLAFCRYKVTNKDGKELATITVDRGRISG